MQKLEKIMDKLEQLMVASTFAQAGCRRTARTIMREEKRPNSRRPVQRTRVAPEQRPVMRI